MQASERERERERGRYRERQRQREAETETDRKTETEIRPADSHFHTDGAIELKEHATIKRFQKLSPLGFVGLVVIDMCIQSDAGT